MTKIGEHCQAVCSVPVKIAVKHGLNISRWIVCHPPDAFCCFRAKRQTFMASLSLFSRLNLLIKRLTSLPFFSSRWNACRPRDAFCWFCAKNSIVCHGSSPSSTTPFKWSYFSFKCTKCFTFSVVSLHLIRNTISKNVHGNRGAILTTHSMEEADALCSRVGIMVKGQLKWVS